MMPRSAGGHRPLGQMVSSGRLSGPPKRNGGKRRSSSLGRRAVSPDSGYSLYSTESEDQVAVIHRGLDRCAALLQDFLLTEPARPRGASSRRRGARISAAGSPKPRAAKRSLSRTRADAAGRVHAEPRRTGATAVVKKETLAAGGSTAFNGRLTSSTPTPVSPPRAPPPATKPTTPPATQTHARASPRVATFASCVPVSTATPEVTTAISAVAMPTRIAALCGTGPALLPTASDGGAPWLAGRWAEPVRGHGTLGADRALGVYGAHGVHGANGDLAAESAHRALSPSGAYGALGADGGHAHFVALHPEWQAPVTTDTSGEEDRPQDRFPEQAKGIQHASVPAPEQDQDPSGSDWGAPEGARSGGRHGEIARRVDAVARGLTRLRELLARQDVRACVRLLAQLECSVELLATVETERGGDAGELGSPTRTLALMRNENAVLHRRVQTLSQQLSERERLHSDSATEVASLRAENAALREQLNRGRAETESVRRHQHQPSLQLSPPTREGGPGTGGGAEVGSLAGGAPNALGGPAGRWEEEEAVRVREEVEAALCCLRSVREQLHTSRDEAERLRLQLAQRDEELHALRQLSASLQGSMTRLLSELSCDVRPGLHTPSLTFPPHGTHNPPGALNPHEVLVRPTATLQNPLRHKAPRSAGERDSGLGAAGHGGRGGQNHWDFLGGAAHGATKGHGDRGHGGQIVLDRPSGVALRVDPTSPASGVASPANTTARAAAAAGATTAATPGAVVELVNRSSSPLSTTHDDTGYLDPPPPTLPPSSPSLPPPPLLPDSPVFPPPPSLALPVAKQFPAPGSYPSTETASIPPKEGGASGGTGCECGPLGGSARWWAEMGGREPDLESDAGSEAFRAPAVLLPLRPLPDWSFSSLESASTFTSRDDHAFRHGLASLDASIARLQRALTSRLQR